MQKWDLIFDKIQQKGRKVIAENTLLNTTWLKTQPAPSEKTLFIFKSNNQFLVSKDGEVMKGNWEFMNAGELLLISVNQSDSLFNCIIVNNEYLLLNKDGSNSPNLFVNYEKFKEFSFEVINKIIEQNISSSSSLPSNQKEIKQQEIFFFEEKDKLIKPKDPRVADLQTDSTEMILKNLRKFEEYVSHYSNELPVYLCYELNKRGQAISPSLVNRLNQYAKEQGHKNFEEYIAQFRTS